jgi:hypothetical protein
MHDHFLFPKRPLWNLLLLYLPGDTPIGLWILAWMASNQALNTNQVDHPLLDPLKRPHLFSAVFLSTRKI